MGSVGDDLLMMLRLAHHCKHEKRDFGQLEYCIGYWGKLTLFHKNRKYRFLSKALIQAICIQE